MFVLQVRTVSILPWFRGRRSLGRGRRDGVGKKSDLTLLLYGGTAATPGSPIDGLQRFCDRHVSPSFLVT